MRIHHLTLTALAGTAFALILVAPAAAKDKPGSACPTVGATTTIVTQDGPQTYRCEQRHDDPCPVWHWAYNREVPKGRKPASTCPVCAQPQPAQPAGRVEAAPVASQPQARPAASRPAVATLPVTGPSGWVLAAVVVAMGVAGVALMWAGRRRRSA